MESIPEEGNTEPRPPTTYKQQIAAQKQLIQRQMDLTYEDILTKMGVREQGGKLFKTVQPPIPTDVVAPVLPQKKIHPAEELYRLRNAAIQAMIQREKARRLKPKKMFY